MPRYTVGKNSNNNLNPHLYTMIFLNHFYYIKIPIVNYADLKENGPHRDWHF